MSVAKIWLQKSIAPVLSICMLGGIWGAWHYFMESEVAEEPEATATAEVRTEVRLSDLKRERAGVKIGVVEQRVLQATAIVPGRVSYDESKHVQLKSATAGTISKYLVKPGDPIKKGDLLAVLSSPEIGQARAAEKQQAAELELLNRSLSFQRERRTGIETLVAAIKRGDTPEKIRESQATEQIGAPRETLLIAYSQLLFAKTQILRISSATGSGAIAGRIERERGTQLETAEATLRSNIEQILFDSHQEVAKATAAVEAAQRQLELARQKTATLMGYQSAIEVPARQESPGDNLAIVEIRSPMDGSVEEKLLAESERVNPGDGLLVIADTSNFWIKAQLRESQWRGLTLKPGDVIKVASPALGSDRLDAHVYFVGREVDQATNAIPIVATIANESRLRPGLFVNVEVSIGDKNDCIAVPESAVATHELQTFVFVPREENRFERCDVEIGERSGGWIEIKQGLDVGDSIATDGVFFLKSELLLEAED